MRSARLSRDGDFAVYYCNHCGANGCAYPEVRSDCNSLALKLSRTGNNRCKKMELTKTDNGKWKPGQSGNINGRPVGSHRLMRKEIRLVVRLIVVPRCGLISRRRLRLGDFSCPIAIHYRPIW